MTEIELLFFLFCGFYFSLLCAALGKSSDELAWELQGSGLYSDLLGFEFTLLTSLLKPHPVIQWRCSLVQTVPFSCVFVKGFRLGWTQVLHIKDAAADT